MDGATTCSVSSRPRPAALFDGCVQAGVRRVIHISAVGADPAGPSKFSRTKAAAEAHLQTLPLDWVILRPALVLGPGFMVAPRFSAALPPGRFVVPVAYAGARLQVVSLDDLAETVVRALACRRRAGAVGGRVSAG